MTPTTTRKLSPAQREDLQYAIKRGGRVVCSRSTTLVILAECGYIQKRLAILDDIEWLRVVNERDRFINKAKEALNDGRWEVALTGLQLAKDEQRSLDLEVWWITEAGRAALGAQ